MKAKIKLLKPILINNKSIKELSYDVEEITAEMFNNAAAMASSSEGRTNMNVMELDNSLHLFLGMYAIIAVNPEIDIEDLKRIKGKDIITITRIGRNFITRSSEETSEAESSEEQSEIIPESSTQESTTSEE